MTAKRTITVEVNGKRYQREIEPRLTLADFLRHELNLTGTHVGCEHGVCGACTILLNGLSTRSCLTFAVQTDGQSVTTIEGLAAPDGTLSPIQQAMAENHGLQCGFCTPGVLMTLTELLRDDPDPDEAKIREVLTGNLCRCTGYTGIVAAARAAARHVRDRAEA
jgi:aerobic-type carbon monoxide dehydrogenase small subunit (CoxS/CutS family)